MAKIQNPTKVITGVNTRWSYANVWDAKSINGGAPKYSVSLIIPKSDSVTVNKIKAAIEAAYEEGQSKLKGNGKTVPALSILKTPLRDGDLERPDDPAYANAYFINANSASNVFAEGKDIYCASASQMFGVPVEKHGINSHLRQKGKIAELALGYGGSVGALISMYQ